jgi:hypothetical protein
LVPAPDSDIALDPQVKSSTAQPKVRGGAALLRHGFNVIATKRIDRAATTTIKAGAYKQITI